MEAAPLMRTCQSRFRPGFRPAFSARCCGEMERVWTRLVFEFFRSHGGFGRTGARQFWRAGLRGRNAKPKLSPEGNFEAVGRS